MSSEREVSVTKADKSYAQLKEKKQGKKDTNTKIYQT